MSNWHEPDNLFIYTVSWNYSDPKPRLQMARVKRVTRATFIVDTTVDRSVTVAFLGRTVYSKSEAGSRFWFSPRDAWQAFFDRTMIDFKNTMTRAGQLQDAMNTATMELIECFASPVSPTYTATSSSPSTRT